MANKTSRGSDESASEEDGEAIWNLNEVHEVVTSVSHIRPKSDPKREKMKLPKTKKKSLIQKLSRRSSEPPLPTIVQTHKEKYKKLKKKGRIKEANEELRLYQKTFTIAKVNRAFMTALASVSINRDKLKKPTKKLETGKYGKVFVVKVKQVKDQPKKVKIETVLKTLNADATMEEQHCFLREMTLLKRLTPHSNIVNLIGCCIEQEPYFMIMEFAKSGNLRRYLIILARKTLAVDYEIYPQSDHEELKEIVAFKTKCITDTVDGMAYLASEKIIHCDLGCYNVLINDHRSCKITDFYYAKDGKEDPPLEDYRIGESPQIRNKAIESMTDGVYTTKTDVWSYGILVWEIMSLGAKPYIEVKDKDIVTSVSDGLRPAKPDKCSERIYKIMKSCWEEDPDERPTFDELKEQVYKLPKHKKKKKKARADRT